MADCGLGDRPAQVLTTYALGSCIGLAIHDAAAGVGGMLHFMLPDSSIDPQRARQNPYLFADTGIPLLLDNLRARGASFKRMVVRAAGGAQMMDREGVFEIGKRNYVAMRKILWKAGVLIDGEEVGGTHSRTMRLEIGSGRVWLHESGASREFPAKARTKGSA
jgi:chemotaxis protein CheD